MFASTSFSSDDLSSLLFAHCASGFGNGRAFCRYRPPPVHCSLVGDPTHCWEQLILHGRKREPCAQVILSKSFNAVGFQQLFSLSPKTGLADA